MYRIVAFDEGTEGKGGTIVYDPRVNRHIISGKLTLKQNQIDDLTLVVNQANPLFDKVRPMHTHINVYDDDDLIFRGRAIKPTKSMETSGQFTREYVFEDIEAYLLDTNQRFDEVIGLSPADYLAHLIDFHNAETDEYKSFEIGKCDVDDPKDNDYRQIDYPSTLDAIREKLVNSLGGYILTKYNPDGLNTIDYLKEVGEEHKTDTPIQLSKNMKAASMSIDPTKVITRVIPVGKRLEPMNVTVPGAGGTGGSLDSVQEWAKSAINASWGCDVNKMKSDFAARSNRVQAWGVDVDRLYDIIRDNGVSPEWFFAYELCEQGSGWGWLNHTYKHGDAYTDAAYVCNWIKDCANSATISPAWWAPEGSMPANPALAAQWQNDYPQGTIGRVYLQGTAAATWEMANANPWPNAYIGRPMSQCINWIKSWGGSSQSGGTSSGGGSVGVAGGSWGWPFPSVGEGTFAQVQSFGYDGGYRVNGFHDGLDFGSYDHPGSEIHAIHGGTVILKNYMAGLGWYFVTHSNDGFNIVYQEAFSSSANIFVNIGDTVQTGDVVGIRTTDHLHVGVTKANFMDAVRKSFTDDGTWLDPQKLIREGGDGSLASIEDTTVSNDTGNGPRPRLDITSVNDGKDYIDIPELIDEFGIIEGIIEFDDIDDPQALKEAAERWIEQQKIPQTWRVTALELHLPNFKSFKVNDKYQFINPYVAETQMLQVIQKEIDLVHPQESQLTIGDKYIGLDDYQAETNNTFQTYQRSVVKRIGELTTGQNNGSSNVTSTPVTADDIQKMKNEILQLQNDSKQDRDNAVSVADYNKLLERVKVLEEKGN